METRSKAKLRKVNQEIQQIEKVIKIIVKQESSEELLVHPDDIQGDPIIEEIIRNKKIKVECED